MPIPLPTETPPKHAPPLPEMTALIEKHTGSDGTHATAIASLSLNRRSVPRQAIHGVQKPSLCLIAQGSKQVMLGDTLYTYDTSRFLLLTVDLPVVGQVRDATPDAPYLSLCLDIDPAQIGTLLTEADLPPLPRPAAPQRGITVGCVDALLGDAVLRLLRLLERPQHIGVLAPLIIHEILFLLLTGEQGAPLRRVAFSESGTHGIADALRRLKRDFAEPLRIDALAQEAHMSASVFHQHFKALTAMTPLQYQKSLRLQEARRLMLAQDLDAATASFQVGYESPSQFSREYRRLFGDAPQRDMARLRQSP